MTISYISQKVKREINVLFWVTMGIFFLGFLFGRVVHAEELNMDTVVHVVKDYAGDSYWRQYIKSFGIKG